MIFVGGELGSELAQVVVEDHADGVRAVAVHINQGIEAAFWAGEQPVDRALFVKLDVVGVELLDEVVANGLSFFAGQVLWIESVFKKLEILFVVFGAEGDFEKLFEG